MNFASRISKLGTHLYIFKIFIMPEMNDIQSLILKGFTRPVWIGYNRILPREMHDPNFFRTKLVGILKNLIKMFFYFRGGPTGQDFYYCFRMGIISFLYRQVTIEMVIATIITNLFEMPLANNFEPMYFCKPIC